MGVYSDYIILPAGGESNEDALKKALEEIGKRCILIKDGDTNGNNTIKKDCIELYTPLEYLNNILNVNLSEMPNSKAEIFSKTVIEEERHQDSVKRILASHADQFLDSNNPLVEEIAIFLNLKK